MTRGSSFQRALAGVLGLPLDERALWPDIIVGACLAFALLFVVGSFITFVFDGVFFASLIASGILLLIANRKKAVLAGALLFPGIRFVVAAIISFEFRFLILATVLFVLSAVLIRNSWR